MGKVKKIFKAITGDKPKAPALPPPVDPAIERAKTENEATAKANAEAAAKRRSRRASSLLATGASGLVGKDNESISSALAMGKDKLGA